MLQRYKPLLAGRVEGESLARFQGSPSNVSGVFLPDLLQQGMDGNPIFHIIRNVFGCYFKLREEIVKGVCHFEPLIHFNVNQTDARFLFNTVLIIEGVVNRSVLEKDYTKYSGNSVTSGDHAASQNAWEIQAF